jgi:hypothetical protein
MKTDTIMSNLRESLLKSYRDLQVRKINMVHESMNIGDKCVGAIFIVGSTSKVIIKTSFRHQLEKVTNL